MKRNNPLVWAHRAQTIMNLQVAKFATWFGWCGFLRPAPYHVVGWTRDVQPIFARSSGEYRHLILVRVSATRTISVFRNNVSEQYQKNIDIVRNNIKEIPTLFRTISKKYRHYSEQYQRNTDIIPKLFDIVPKAYFIGFSNYQIDNLI